nr:EamA/RhaT family transporter [Lysobacter sp.]
LLLTPVFAIALGIAFWGDRPGPRLIIGGVMVLGGVLIVALRAMAKSRSLPRPEPI